MSKFPAVFIVVMIFSCLRASGQNQARFSDVKPGMTNKALERQAVWLANKRGMNYNWHQRYKKAVIISRKWDLLLDKNGFLKGRRIHMELYAEFPNGKCAMADFSFRQKLLVDETFSDELQYDSAGDIVEIECE